MGHKWERYWSLIRSETEPEEAALRLGFTKYCCQRMLVATPPRLGADAPDPPAPTMPYSFASSTVEQKPRWVRAV